MKIEITREDNNLDALLSVILEFEDIRTDAEKNLHAAKQKMNLPGFRPGKVPLSIAKNYLWEKVIGEELEKKLETSINEYFKTNNLELLKPLFPVETEEKIDLKNFTSHEFKYEIGLLDPIEIEPLNYLREIKLYDIQPDKEDINLEIEKIRESNGEFIRPESIEDISDLRVYGEFTELSLENEIMEEGLKQKFSKSLSEIPDKLKNVIIGLKTNETTDVNIDEIFGSRDEMADFLKIEKLTADDLSMKFRINIISIYLHKKAELNEDLFKRFTEGKASNFEDFFSEVSKMMKDTYNRNAENKVFDEIYKTLMDKLDIRLPEKYTDKLFTTQHEHHDHDKGEQESEEKLKEEREKFISQMKWSVISDNLSKKFEIQADDKEIIKEAYLYISMLYYQYGIRDIKPDKISKDIKEFLKNPDNTMQMKERVISGKLLDKIKNDLNLKPVEISVQDYKALN